MTADDLLSVVGGPVASFLVLVAVYLLGFSLIHMIGRSHA